MQRNQNNSSNGGGGGALAMASSSSSSSPATTAACAACKHQRKKCHESCPLAPYFPADRNREFQAVHKVFGVSNVTKMVKSVVKDEDRKKTVETLVWEAICRQNDPILGPYAEYKKVLEELKMYKSQNHNQNPISQISQNQNQNQILPIAGQVGMTYKPIMPSLGGWNNGMNNNNNNNNSMNNGNGLMGIINGGVNSNNLFNYIHDNLSAIIDSSPYSNSSTYNFQSHHPEKFMRLQQEKEIISSSVVMPQIQQQQHPNAHHCF